ncbi:hypothetical protein C0993_008496 [Termitomyces sp. T159_Od127]|nr:hypothetical protein C0993_008496 [Termitomyces sp. T159_Od127]
MPLIIHPSSCCDICLETLTYNDKPPFAIPCGHIFCRSCLFGLNPSLCPLCRKPFLPERSKKLITGDLEIAEVAGIEDKRAIELLAKLVNSLDTERYDSATLEVDVWLSAGNTHVLLQKAHEVFKEFLLLKSERSASQRSIRRLQREMRRLEVDKSTEKENASAKEQLLLSQVEALRENEQEERHRATTTVTFNHNPLPTPPEPLPLDSLPFLTNLQQNYNLSNETPLQSSSDRKIQSAAHPSGDPANPNAESRTAAAPRAPSNDRTSIPFNPIIVNGQVASHRNAIIPGASPNQRYISRTVLDDSNIDRTSIYEQSAVQVDPFALATDYLQEYAAGFQEGYQLNRRNGWHRWTEPVVPSVTEPASRSSAFSNRTLDYRFTQQSDDLPTTSQPVRSPLGLRNLYTASTTFPQYRRDDPELAPRVSSSRPSTPIYNQPWIQSHWPTLQSLSLSPAPTEPSATPSPVHRAPNSSSSPTPPSSVSSSSISGHSALPVRVTPTMSSDTGSSRSSRASSLSRASGRDRTSVEIFWDPASGIPAPNTPDTHLSVRPAPVVGITDSPASGHTIESWGTVSTNNSNLVFQRPFMPAYQISSVSDLQLRFFDDFTDSSHAGTASQRTSLFSDVVPPILSSHIGLEDSDNVGTYRSDSQNRTPRFIPRPLPGNESVSSLEGGFQYVLPQATDSHWNISNSTYRDFGHDYIQHHGTPSDASETWHRAIADLTSIQSRSHTQSQSHSQSISGPVSDRSPRTSRQRSSRSSSVATHNNPTPLRRETPVASTNALGLTDLTSSPEPRISAPAPITPSQSFLRYYR